MLQISTADATQIFDKMNALKVNMRMCRVKVENYVADARNSSINSRWLESNIVIALNNFEADEILIDSVLTDWPKRCDEFANTLRMHSEDALSLCDAIRLMMRHTPPVPTMPTQ